MGRTKVISMRFVLFTAVLASAAFAEKPTERRVAALVVPMDKNAEGLALKLEGYIDDALKEYQGFRVKTTDELFGVISDEDAGAALKRAEIGYHESRDAFDNKVYDDAERKLRATIKEYGKAVAAMKGCGNLCDALAMLAATLHLRGDSEEAKLVLLDLFAAGSNFELDKKRFAADFVILRSATFSSRAAQLRGNVVVKTKPAGARVYVNGEFQGFTPVTLQTLRVGKTLIRVERPGFKAAGQMVEVTPEDQEIEPELVASSSYAAYDGLMDRLAAEALKEKGGATMVTVANSLKLDRGIVAILKELDGGGQTELTVAYCDLKTGKRIASKKANFRGDEYGQLKSEVVRMVTALLNNTETGEEAAVRSSDPLDHKGGTEDWNSEDRGGRTTKRDKKKKGGDPLEGVNGTEDW